MRDGMYATVEHLLHGDVIEREDAQGNTKRYVFQYAVSHRQGVSARIYVLPFTPRGSQLRESFIIGLNVPVRIV